MNKFFFEGRAADAPELNEAANGKKIARFRLIKNEYAGKGPNGERREVATTIQFTAWDAQAEALARNVLKGDQLIITARIRNNNYETNDGTSVYGFNFEVEDFSFGAPGAEKRAQLAARS